MRYSLRNQSRIKKAFGDKYLNRIKSSLDAYFSSNYGPGSITTLPITGSYPVIEIMDKGQTDQFYIIGKMFDVYNLALKRERPKHEKDNTKTKELQRLQKM